MRKILRKATALVNTLYIWIQTEHNKLYLIKVDEKSTSNLSDDLLHKTWHITVLIEVGLNALTAV